MAIMAAGGTGGKLAKEICDAFGLKYVRKLDIHMAYNEIFTVTAEFYPEIDGIRQMVPILKKFELVEIQDCKNQDETTVIGDQVRTFVLKEDVKC
jgi:hypothetical protein